jgi:hypothetical protein|eukprot:SAG11_NODE_5_length_32399_cov_6.724118_18_plen_76_part_00
MTNKFVQEVRYSGWYSSLFILTSPVLPEGLDGALIRNFVPLDMIVPSEDLSITWYLGEANAIDQSSTPVSPARVN